MKKTTAPFLFLVALLLIVGAFQALKANREDDKGTSSSVAETLREDPVDGATAPAAVGATPGSITSAVAPAAVSDAAPELSADGASAEAADARPVVPGPPATGSADPAAAPPAGKSSPDGVATREPATPKAGCFKVSFQHKVTAGHPDRARCARHRNFVQLEPAKEQAAINWKTVCLRVDGVVTPFERRGGGIGFGPLAGPESRVTVSYCRGKATCAVPCPVPSDPFLEAISASLKREKSAPVAVAKWDPSDTEEEADPTQALEAELKDDAGLQQHGLSLFSEWLATSRVPGCGTTVATREIAGKDLSK